MGIVVMTARRFDSFTDGLGRPSDIDLVAQWLAARDNEKSGAKTYHGTRPCIPVDALLAVCRRIFNQTTKTKP
jgi:hypothetical protein